MRHRREDPRIGSPAKEFPAPVGVAPVGEPKDASLTRSFVGLGLGEAAARLIAFVTTLLIARRLGADGLGIVSFSFAILLYLQRFVDAGFDLGIGIREAASRQARLASFVPPVLALRLAMAMGMIALTVLASALVPSLEFRMAALYSLTLVPLALGTRWVLTGVGTTRPVGVSRGFGELVVLLAVSAAVVDAGDLWRVPVSQLLGDTLAALLLLLALRRTGLGISVRWDVAAVRPLVRHMTPYVGSALLGLAIFNSDLLFLRAFSDRATVGLYASAYALVSFLINVGATYSLSLIPALTRLGGEPARRQDLYDTAWARAIAIVLPIAVGGIMIAGDTLDLVFGPAFAAAGPVLMVLLVSVPLSVLRSIATSALTAEGREGTLFRTVFAAAGANIAMNLIAVPLFGMLGAAAVTVATELLRLALAQFFANRLGIRAPRAQRHWKAALAAVSMAAVLATGLARSPTTAVVLGALVYGIALLMLGGIGRDANGRPQLHV